MDYYRLLYIDEVKQLMGGLKKLVSSVFVLSPYWGRGAIIAIVKSVVRTHSLRWLVLVCVLLAALPGVSAVAI